MIIDIKGENPVTAARYRFTEESFIIFATLNQECKC